MKKIVAGVIFLGMMEAACMSTPTSPNSSTTRDIQFGFYSSSSACRAQSQYYQCRDYTYSSSSGACTGLRCSK